MPVLPHLRYTWEGIVGTPAEPLDSWSFSLKTYEGATTPENYDAYALSAREAWSSYLRSLMPPTTQLIRTKCARIGADGRTVAGVNGALLQGEDPVVSAGTSAGTAPVMPLQIALVCSLVTERQGATGKGRFFLPWPDVSIAADDRRLSAGSAGVIAAACADFVEAVGAIIPGASVVVASSKGYHTPVTAVRIGRAPDTMRSRRSDLPEGHVPANVGPI